LNGVTKAVSDPRNFVWAAMNFLPRLRNGTTEKLTSTHIGSGDQAKGLCRMALALCFDALSQVWPVRCPDKAIAAILPR
jgi:hypothetical protein